ncbi:MAG TPA: hypothetical protein VFC03_02930 [Acidimicrobiales bacterium]|jgi:hypothetical protein|nr:hypothetical protein [Acidimicrobiales bacterium]
MNHQSEILTAIERSHARRQQAESQLRSLRGMALSAPLAELDSLLVYELRLETRLAEVLSRNSRSAVR